MKTRPFQNKDIGILLKKALAVFVAGVFLFTNTVGWAQEDRLFSTGMERIACSSGLADKNKLAPFLRSKEKSFLERFLAGEVLLSHERNNEYIKKQIDLAGEAGLSKAVIEVRGIGGGVELIAIPGLLKHTGLFAHVGLGRKHNKPVIYIDSRLYHDEDIRQHETDEILKWEALRNLLGLEPRQMREWIKRNISNPVNDERLPGDYRGKTSCEIADIIHRSSHHVPGSLYKKYVNDVDYEYLAALTVYDDEENKKYKEDITISSHEPVKVPADTSNEAIHQAIINAYKELKNGKSRRIEGDLDKIVSGKYGFLQCSFPSPEGGSIGKITMIGCGLDVTITTLTIRKDDDGNISLGIGYRKDGIDDTAYMVREGKRFKSLAGSKIEYDIRNAYKELKNGEGRRIKGDLNRFIHEKGGFLQRGFPSPEGGNIGKITVIECGLDVTITTLTIRKYDDGNISLEIGYRKDGVGDTAYMTQDGKTFKSLAGSKIEYDIRNAYKELKNGEGRRIKGDLNKIGYGKGGRLKNGFPSPEGGIIGKFASIGCGLDVTITTLTIRKDDDGNILLEIGYSKNGVDDTAYMTQDGKTFKSLAGSTIEYGIINAYKELKNGESRRIEGDLDKIICGKYGFLEKSFPSPEDGNIDKIATIGCGLDVTITTLTIRKDDNGNILLEIGYSKNGVDDTAYMVQDGKTFKSLVGSKMEYDIINAYKELKSGESRRIEGEPNKFIFGKRGYINESFLSPEGGSIGNNPQIGCGEVDSITSLTIRKDDNGNIILEIGYRKNGIDRIARMIRRGRTFINLEGARILDICQRLNWNFTDIRREIPELREEQETRFFKTHGILKEARAGILSAIEKNRLKKKRTGQACLIDSPSHSPSIRAPIPEESGKVGMPVVLHNMQYAGIRKEKIADPTHEAVRNAYKELKNGESRAIEGNFDKIIYGKIGFLKHGFPSPEGGIIHKPAQIGCGREVTITSLTICKDDDGNISLEIGYRKDGVDDTAYMTQDGKTFKSLAGSKIEYDIRNAYKELKNGESRRIKGDLNRFIYEKGGLLKHGFPSPEGGIIGKLASIGCGLDVTITTLTIRKDDNGNILLEIGYSKNGVDDTAYMTQDGKTFKSLAGSKIEYDIRNAYKELKNGESRRIEGDLDKIICEKYGFLQYGFPSPEGGNIDKITTIGCGLDVTITTLTISKDDDGKILLEIEYKKDGVDDTAYMVQDGKTFKSLVGSRMEYDIINAYNTLKNGESRAIEGNFDKIIYGKIGFLKHGFPSPEGGIIHKPAQIGCGREVTITTLTIRKDDNGNILLEIGYSKNGVDDTAYMTQDGKTFKSLVGSKMEYDIINAYNTLKNGESRRIKGDLNEIGYGKDGQLKKSFPSPEGGIISKHATIGCGVGVTITSLTIRKDDNGNIILEIGYRKNGADGIARMIRRGRTFINLEGARILDICQRLNWNFTNIRHEIPELREGQETNFFKTHGILKEARAGILSTVENRLKKKRMGQACLIDSPSYSPFIHAPILEELGKVGMPVVLYYILNKATPYTPILNQGIFAGILIALGAVFTILHALKIRGPPTFSSLTIKDKSLVLAAPLAAAVSGIALSLIFILQPSLAIASSMFAHLIINVSVAIVNKYFKCNMRYASIRKEKIADPIHERERILALCERWNWCIDDPARRQELCLLPGEGAIDFFQRTGILKKYVATLPRLFKFAGTSIREQAEALGLSERAFLLLMGNIDVGFLKSLGLEDLLRKQAESKKMPADDGKRNSAYSSEEAVRILEENDLLKLFVALANYPEEFVRAISALLPETLTMKELRELMRAFTTLNVNQVAMLHGFPPPLPGERDRFYLAWILERGCAERLEKLTREQQEIFIKGYLRFSYKRFSKDPEKAYDEFIKEINPHLPSAFLENLKEEVRREFIEAIKFEPKHLRTELLPHQKIAAYHLRSRENYMLMDDARVGKSIQVLAALDPEWTTLIVAPANCLGTWKEEIDAHFRPENKPTVAFLRGSPEKKLSILREVREKKGRTIILASIEDLLRSPDYDLAELSDILDLAVIDEWQNLDHYLGDDIAANALQAQSIQGLRSPRKWLLTATPYNAKAERLFALFHYFMKDKAGVPDRYMNFNIFKKVFTEDIKGLKMLHGELAMHSLRREREDVFDYYDEAPEGPDRTRTIPRAVYRDYKKAGGYYLNEEQVGLHLKMIRNFRGFLKEVYNPAMSEEDRLDPSTKANILTMLRLLEWAAIDPRLVGGSTESSMWAELEKIAQDRIAKGRKGIIYSYHHKITDEIERRFKKIYGEKAVALIDGRVVNGAKDKERHVFQEDPECKVIIMGLDAGVGVDLSDAEWVVYVQQPMTYIKDLQTTARPLGMNRSRLRPEVEIIRMIGRYPEEAMRQHEGTEDMKYLSAGTFSEVQLKRLGAQKMQFELIACGAVSDENGDNSCDGHMRKLAASIPGVLNNPSIIGGLSRRERRFMELGDAFITAYEETPREKRKHLIAVALLYKKNNIDPHALASVIENIGGRFDFSDLEVISSLNDVPNRYQREYLLSRMPDLVETTYRQGYLSLNKAVSILPASAPIYLRLAAFMFISSCGRPAMAKRIRKLFEMLECEKLTGHERRQLYTRFATALIDGSSIGDLRDGAVLVGAYEAVLGAGDKDPAALLHELCRLGTIVRVQGISGVSGFEMGADIAINYHNAVERLFGIKISEEFKLDDLEPWVKFFLTLYRGRDAAVKDTEKAGYVNALEKSREILSHVLAGDYDSWRRNNGSIKYLEDNKDFWDTWTAEEIIRSDMEGWADLKELKIAKAVLGRQVTGSWRRFMDRHQGVKLIESCDGDMVSARVHEFLTSDNKRGWKINLGREKSECGTRLGRASGEEKNLLESLLSDYRYIEEWVNVFDMMEKIGGREALQAHQFQKLTRTLNSIKIRAGPAVAEELDDIISSVISFKDEMPVYKDVEIVITRDPSLMIRRGMLAHDMVNCFHLDGDPDPVSTLANDLGSMNTMLVIVKSGGAPAAVAVAKIRRTEDGQPVIYLEKPLYRKRGGKGYNFEKEMVKALAMTKAARLLPVPVIGVCKSSDTHPEKIIHLYPVGSYSDKEYSEAVFGVRNPALLRHSAELADTGGLIMRKEFFTAGYEGTSIEEFVAGLKEASIATLVDVRAVPLSKKPGFSKQALEKRLGESGIEYVHMGELGAPEKLRRLEKRRGIKAFFEAYREHLTGNAGSVRRLADLVGRRKAALMCFEADPARCHRSVLAAEIIKSSGMRASEIAKGRQTGGSPKGTPVTCLNTVKNNVELMRKALNKDVGISVADVAGFRDCHPGTVFKEFQILKLAGIFVPVEGRRGYYRFADMMLGPGENYTKTLINAISDMRYKTGKRGEDRPLNRWDIDSDKLPVVRELIKMTILHQINIRQRPGIPEGKVLWHILEQDIVSISQRSSFAQEVNNAAEKSDAPERIWILKRGESIKNAIARISKNHPDAIFDVALSKKGHIKNVPGNIKRLVFEGIAGDFAQLEGIIAALRALHGPKENIVAALKSIYAVLKGAACQYDISPDVLDDPVKFARSFIFDLPPAAPIPAAEIPKINKVLLQLLIAA